MKNISYSQSFVNILGIKITSTPKEELLNQVQDLLSKKIHFYIFTPNPEIVLKATKNPSYFRALNSARFNIPDGIGLKLANSNLKVIKGREFMIDLFKIANDNKFKVYLLGGTRQVNKEAQKLLISKYPNVLVSGSRGPKLDSNANPVSEVDSKLHSETLRDINTFKPDILIVAFGAPKQELWVTKMSSKLDVKCTMVVGGSLNYFTGKVKPVPQIFQVSGLEWLWRLLLEPKKRFRRIINAVIVFPLTLLVYRLKNLV